jgi:hypothetical protein
MCRRLQAYIATVPHLWEVLLDHCADVLRVVEVQCCIHLVQDVDGRGLEPACSAMDLLEGFAHKTQAHAQSA